MAHESAPAQAITFDFYNTLCQFSPPREERQAQAAGAHGLTIRSDALRAAYVVAEHLWTLENARSTIALRSAAERRAFYAEYEQTLLAAAGAAVAREMALRVYESYAALPRGLVLFDDALAALRAARAGGAKVAIISNTDTNLAAVCDELGLAEHLDALICSCDVGVEKPAPEIFHAAIRQLGVAAQRAVHVGDQYHSDVVGARAVGLHALLLDRLGLAGDYPGCRKVDDLLSAVALSEQVTAGQRA